MYLIAIFFLALVLRTLNIQEFLFFGFEQGRDALIIDGILKNSDFVLVGPSTSIGGLFHGVWFYYLLGVPYLLSGGNPLVASVTLILLGSLVSIVIYYLATDIFKSNIWAITASILVAISYEYILYSRWLSNVSPAPLFIAMAFYSLWKFISKKGEKFFILFVLFAAIASSFQMILIPQFIFAVVLLNLFGEFGNVKIKNLLIALSCFLIIFLPAIIFDFRNEHITFNSLRIFASESGTSNGGRLLSGIQVFGKELYNHLKLSFINIDSLVLQIGIVITVLIGLITKFKKSEDRKILAFLFSWVLMIIPLIIISPGNPQYYVGFGIAWILLVCFSLRKIARFRYGFLVVLVFAILILISFALNINNLISNKNIFFRTTQVDLNLKDQRAILDYIENDSKGESYKFVNFTIPSLQPEGWQYLQKYYYPNSYGKNGDLIYITIEQGVYPVWENKWIGDLGKTRLESERKFGLIRLQKRIVEK